MKRAKGDNPLVNFLLENPRYFQLLEKALKKDFEVEQKGIASLGWEAYEIGALGPEMNKLRRLDLVEVVYKSNKHAGYRLKNKQQIEEALEIARRILSGEE